MRGQEDSRRAGKQHEHNPPDESKKGKSHNKCPSGGPRRAVPTERSITLSARVLTKPRPATSREAKKGAKSTKQQNSPVEKRQSDEGASKQQKSQRRPIRRSPRIIACTEVSSSFFFSGVFLFGDSFTSGFLVPPRRHTATSGSLSANPGARSHLSDRLGRARGAHVNDVVEVVAHGHEQVEE